MEGNIGATSSFGGGGQVVGIGFAWDFEDGDGNGFGQGGARCEPLRICPRIDDLFGVGISVGEFPHVIKCVVN